MMQHSLKLAGIGKSFASDDILKNIDLDVRPGEFLSLVGMSGCGKSTLLRIIAGLERPDRGQVLIDNSDVTDMDPSDRNLAMVFQSYALYPHMTVRQNIATPLRMRRLSLAGRLPLIGRLVAPSEIVKDIKRSVEEAAETLQISHLLDRRPAQLSGGQRQRVALARALVRSPAAFLMDEPLSNLDAKLRAHMREELAGLHRRLGATFIYVTHDQIEAMTMSDRVALMHEGRIEQLGTPDELYHRPATLTVARFIGTPSINLLPVMIGVQGQVTAFGKDLDLRATEQDSGPATLGLRPEDLRTQDLRAGGNGFAVRVQRSETHGADRFVTCRLVDDETVVVTMRQGAREAIGADAHGLMTIGFTAERAHLFGADGTRCAVSIRERVAA
ncbi:ATP-binding cassette domain-containing protein [Agrobacterium vitis]|uniref:ATP-binding cassette domain-containing protein n=1 Tax=Agrobacterium vitis TaxID=373 RepID=A0ABD6GED3_AGRVI|nr:ABC transporter ATP-binding protein [Agrobacterium vitis]MUO80645.1 ATP-binding cassette domain-containing protein [Agrobacterium vitis]MUO94953.1 ATP-binding cassette domain-containing protein [Agrobacterium vitis]MUP07266.1 ATP-binding cassette domain-containing protein [Agrobacterium vitis]MUZ82000.1 ATP-binding cassette domain-containing protein [Agrobacterium vitis]MVA09733.1 ATP-binding cassette domain-containing protein [Agrobacterium vitis]